MKITGSVALVTGANRGLGKAYVEALLSSGATDFSWTKSPPAIFARFEQFWVMRYSNRGKYGRGGNQESVSYGPLEACQAPNPCLSAIHHRLLAL
jgi:hypothetical protein